VSTEEAGFPPDPEAPDLGLTGQEAGVTWRAGRKVGRTIYAQLGSFASDDDLLIGVMDTPELAAEACAGRNAAAAAMRLAKGAGVTP
jgi:hypothetical protein